MNESAPFGNRLHFDERPAELMCLILARKCPRRLAGDQCLASADGHIDAVVGFSLVNVEFSIVNSALEQIRVA